MRSFVLAFAASLALTALATPRLANAQPAVSDSDRAAARELYFQGSQLQQNGKYAEALDKFQRAQAVLAAPTHLLHIAECQAALGKLVEASETYRTLIRTPLAPTAPAAFQAAQAQGAAELPQVESRIPDLKIDVTPAGAPGLQVSIDDQPMSSALVGVARPINPGTHKIVVSATNYGRSEETVAIRERETKAIAVALQPASAPAFVPPPVAPTGTPIQGSTPIPMATQPPSAYPAPPPPAVYGQAPDKPAAAPSSAGFLLGARIGAIFPGGKIEGTSTFKENAGAGAALGIEAGFRFAKTIYFGAALEGAALSGPSNPPTVASNQVATYTSRTGLAALFLGVITNPQGVGFYGEVGVGYRVFSLTRRLELQSNAAVYAEPTISVSGPEFLLGGGVHIKATEALRIIPKVQLGIGSFNSVSGTCETGGGGPCATPASSTIANTATHTFVFLGVGGYFAHDFK